MLLRAIQFRVTQHHLGLWHQLLLVKLIQCDKSTKLSTTRMQHICCIYIIVLFCFVTIFVEVSFESRNVTAPHLGGKILPPKTCIWGVNRHFQAKHVKYQHLHIIETTASIPTKFCRVISITKYSSWVVQTCT